MAASPITSALPGAGLGASIGVGTGSVAAGVLTAAGLSALWGVIFHQAAPARRNGHD